MSPGTVRQVGNHKLLDDLVSDEAATLLFGAQQAEISYCDPPWSNEELQHYLKLSGLKISLTWNRFVNGFCSVLDGRTTDLIFLELTPTAGCDQIIATLISRGVSEVGRWALGVGVTRTNGFLWCGTKGPAYTPSIDLNGLGGIGAIQAALAEAGFAPGSVVFDPCCGEGCTALATYELGLTFYGNDVLPERIDKAEELLVLRTGANWDDWEDDVIVSSLAREKLRRLHNQQGATLSRVSFYDWERTYFRPRNRAISNLMLALRAVSDVKVPQSDIKYRVRALPAGDPAFDQIDLDGLI